MAADIKTGKAEKNRNPRIPRILLASVKEKCAFVKCVSLSLELVLVERRE